MKTVEIIVVVGAIAGLVSVIVAVALALERRMARKIASSRLGQACPFCRSPLRQEAIRSARLEQGFEDQDVSLVCPDCSKTIYIFEKDHAA